mmetsp:Transcript_42025/g.136372  ORF Transcript_42025/g.136372 Transcript_42025/m.136372 type:complete len:344 (+) Transcript_42025:398-1429(+)
MRTRRPKQPPWSRPGAVWSRPVSWPRLHLPAHTRGQGSSHMFSHVRPQLAVVEAEVDRPHSAAPAQQQELDTLDAEPQLAQRADEAEHLEKSPEEDRVARRRHVAPKVRPRVRPPKQSRGGVCAEDRVLEVRLAEVGSEDEAEGAREGEERQVGEAKELVPAHRLRKQVSRQDPLHAERVECDAAELDAPTRQEGRGVGLGGCCCRCPFGVATRRRGGGNSPVHERSVEVPPPLEPARGEPVPTLRPVRHRRPAASAALPVELSDAREQGRREEGERVWPPLGPRPVPHAAGVPWQRSRHCQRASGKSEGGEEVAELALASNAGAVNDPVRNFALRARAAGRD